MENNEKSLSELGVTDVQPKSKNAVSAADVAKTMQEKHGVAPPEKEKRYDSYTDEIVETYGQKVSDELFEQAKSIIEAKRIESEMNGDVDINIEGGNFIENNIPLSEEEEFDQVDEFDQPSQPKYERRVMTPTQDPVVEQSTPEPIIETPSSEEVIQEPNPSSGTIGDMISEFEDEFDEDGFDEDEFDEENTMNKVKSMVKEMINPLTNKIDISSFTISNKPISVTKSFEAAKMDTNFVADWVLPDSGVILSFIEMKAYDIEKLNPYNSGRNHYNTNKDIYNVIYNHLDGDKPGFEEFLRLIKFSDLDHLYGGIYRSSFDKNNMVTYECKNKGCKEIFIKEIDMDTMYKFVSDEAKERFNNIIESNNRILSDSQFESELIQISDEYVFSIKEPSVFNVIFESAILDNQFKEKYSDIIGLLSYIDSIYYINRDTNSLDPIGLKTYDRDLQKTVKYKVVQYSKIIQKLNSDQYYNLTSVVRHLTPEDTIKYILPEVVCPKCGHTIEEQEMTAETLLFTRHQLGVIGAL